MSMKLYVGNLAFQTTSQELQELFASAGTVESAAVVEDRDTGRSRGFGFVEMSTKEEGAAAISQFNGKEVNGRALNVNEAKPRENRGGGGGRGFFGGGGGFCGDPGGGGQIGGDHRGRPAAPRWLVRGAIKKKLFVPRGVLFSPGPPPPLTATSGARTG